MLAARFSSMSPSSPAGTPDTSLELQDDTTSNRRKSGRVRSKPTLLSDDQHRSQASNGNKRKRVVSRRGDLEDASSEGGSESSDESPDEEELRERRKKARKPAIKMSKAAGTSTLAMRPATNGVKRPAKAKKSRAKVGVAEAGDETGLYGISCP